MSIRKRGGVYFVDIRTPSGERIRRSASTSDRKEAQEYHDKLKSDLWRVSKLGEKAPRTFEEAAMKYLTLSAGSGEYLNKERHLAWFGRYFSGRQLHTITRPEIIDALPTHDQRKLKAPKLMSPATKNRYLATIRNMLNLAQGEWEWIDRVPKLSDAPEPIRRVRWITQEEAQRLILAIRMDWLKEITRFGFATGLRRANILGLEWSQVDLVNRRAWVHPDQAKAGKPIAVPLNDEAVSVIREQIGKHHTHIFTRLGKPIKSWDRKQWGLACGRANITNFRFHDVRHTWASWHVQNGTPLQILMELGGWATYDMVLKYGHLNPARFDQWVSNSNVGAVWAHGALDVQGTDDKKAAVGGF
jgi:integrase